LVSGVGSIGDASRSPTAGPLAAFWSAHLLGGGWGIDLFAVNGEDGFPLPLALENSCAVLLTSGVIMQLTSTDDEQLTLAIRRQTVTLRWDAWRQSSVGA
jgi:hypothetical protein